MYKSVIMYLFGTYLDYYEKTRDLIYIKINNATVFAFEENDKKVVL